MENEESVVSKEDYVVVDEYDELPMFKSCFTCFFNSFGGYSLANGVICVLHNLLLQYL